MGKSGSERLIYLLDVDEKRRLCCGFLLTRLLNWKSFRPAPIRKVSDLMQAQFKKYLSEVDRKLVMQLLYWERSDHPVAVLSGADCFELLQRIVETGRAFLNGGNQLRLQWGEEREGVPKWVKSATGEWRTTLEVEPAVQLLVASSPPCYFDREKNVVGPLRTLFSEELAGSWLNAGAFDKKGMQRFCLRLMNRFPDEKIPSGIGSGRGGLEKISPEVVLRLVRKISDRSVRWGELYSLSDLAQIELRFRYGPRLLDWNSDAATIAFEESGRLRRVERNEKEEAAALKVLEKLGLEPVKSDFEAGFLLYDQGAFELSEKAETDWIELLEKEFPKLKKQGWAVEQESVFNFLRLDESDWFGEVKREKTDWFSFEAGVRYRGKRIPVLPILQKFLRDHQDASTEEIVSLCSEKSFSIALEGGEILLIPGEKIAELLRILFEIRFSGGGDSVRISAWGASRLADSGLAEAVEDELVGRLLKLQRAAENGMELEPVSDLPELPFAPRDYQKEGLAWLDFLRRFELGGILADDMGLGKTMQVLVHLLYEKEQGRLSGPVLVVAPTSVLDSWEKERGRFAPELKMLRFQGIDRAVPEGGFSDFDIVLTSYSLVNREFERLGSEDWELIVLDEAQRIKNSNSETAKALFGYRSKRRLCLSGTPMENHLGELWSLFHFLMPGFLGDVRSFNKMIRRPIENGEEAVSKEISEHFAARIRPFFLRRRKEEVAKELPPRTEVTRLIELSPRQSELYEATRLRLHEELVSELERRGVSSAQIAIFAALMKLRQICCDPRLLEEGADFEDSDSSKLRFLIEMLEGLVKEGRRILVFSQFVTMLRLVSEELEESGIPFLELTGSTKNRGALVERFQSGEIPVFLISLKAGGTGLNLTAADTVIQYDPWWNPAVEQQAADRVYRIGQEKPVFHYRLISEGTIEEKILGLQERKRQLVDSILDGIPSKGNLIDEETLEALFSGIEGELSISD